MQSAELQLFYCALGASQGLRDFTNTFLLGEAHGDHAALILRKLVYQAKEARAAHGVNEQKEERICPATRSSI